MATVFAPERGTPAFAFESTEFAAELLRFLRFPATFAYGASLILWLCGIPVFSWKYDFRGVKTNVIRSYATTITGERLVYHGAVPFIFFIDRQGRITYPVTRF
ncbi:MAG: hypothetical protein ACREF9_13885 [Opitutaceae bacterium]